MSRKKCPIPILEFFHINLDSQGTREYLAQRMTQEWGEEWTKEKLDDVFRAEACPKAETLSKICWTLGLRVFPHPDNLRKEVQ